MTPLAHMGEALGLNARLHPDRPGARDLSRSLTFRQGGAGLPAGERAAAGLGKGERVAILAYNCPEWMEIYAATAKAGLVMVPLNFRLLAGDIAYIIENSGASAVIVQDALLERLEAIGDELGIPPARRIHFGGPTPPGLGGYEALIAAASPCPARHGGRAGDPRALIYTSGTTGRPKGAMRSHGGMALHNLAILANLELARADSCLLVMPMCHANSLFFASAFAYAGAACCVYDRVGFDPEHLLRTSERTSFTSLVPTHYIMMLALPEAVRARCDVSAVNRLLISSAPARRDTAGHGAPQLAPAEMYRPRPVRHLRPEEQPASCRSAASCRLGVACGCSTRPRAEVPDGEVGELFSRTPWCFEGYWKLPEKTAEAFRGDWLSVGDMARRATPRAISSWSTAAQHDHLRRRERHSSEVENLLLASAGARRRGDRPAAREMGRGGACGDRAAGWRDGDRGRDPRLVRGPHCRPAAALGRLLIADAECRARPPARSAPRCGHADDLHRPTKGPRPMTLTGSDLVAQALQRQGVETSST
ncbi:MAG: AMP-binding protein [Dongiaceae bacterium]